MVAILIVVACLTAAAVVVAYLIATLTGM